MNRYYLMLNKYCLAVYRNDGSGKLMSFDYHKKKEINHFKPFISFDLDNRYFVYDDYSSSRFINTCRIFKEKSLVCGRSYNFATKLKSFIEIILIDYIQDDKSEIVFLADEEAIYLIEKYSKEKYRKTIQDIFNELNSDYKDQDCLWELQNTLKYEEVLGGLIRVLSDRYKRNVCLLNDRRLYLRNYEEQKSSELSNKLSEEAIEDDESDYDKYIESITYPLSTEIKESLCNFVGSWENFVNSHHDFFIADEKFAMYCNDAFTESDEYKKRLDSLTKESRELLKEGNYLFHMENALLYYKEAFEILLKEGTLKEIDNYNNEEFMKDVLKFIDFIVKTNTKDYQFIYQKIYAKYKMLGQSVKNVLNYADGIMYYAVPILIGNEVNDFNKQFGINA